MTIDKTSPRSWITLAVFLAVVLGVGTLIGQMATPGEWFDTLEKPFFNPPSWVFAPVWITLYVMIAVAGWLTFIRDPGSSAMMLWAGQMVLNWLWSPTWFILHWQWPAVIVIFTLLAMLIAFIVHAWSRDRVASWLFIPYAAWVGFASILNLTIAIMN